MVPGVLLALALSPKIPENGFRAITFQGPVPKGFLHADALVWELEHPGIDIGCFCVRQPSCAWIPSFSLLIHCSRYQVCGKILLLLSYVAHMKRS